MKLLFRISSKIIRTMCLYGRHLSSLQVRLRCQTVSQAAVRPTNTAQAFFLASKESSIFCMSNTVWSTVGLLCRNPAYSLGSYGSIIGSTQVWISLSRILYGAQSRDIALINPLACVDSYCCSYTKSCWNELRRMLQRNSRVWQELNYRLDKRRVTKGSHIARLRIIIRNGAICEIII